MAPTREIKPLKGHKVIRRIAKPKHAEQFSLEESARWQPWRAILKVTPYAGGDDVDYEVFLRADTPDNVMHTVYQLFNAWEHVLKNRDDYDYPRIRDGYDHFAEKLDEQTYMEQWKLCQRLGEKNGRCKHAGDRRNPTVFRYDPEGWDVPRLIRAGAGDIEFVNNSRNLK